MRGRLGEGRKTTTNSRQKRGRQATGGIGQKQKLRGHEGELARGDENKPGTKDFFASSRAGKTGSDSKKGKNRQLAGLPEDRVLSTSARKKPAWGGGCLVGGNR